LNTDLIRKTDPEIARVIVDEAMRQQSHLELIASENIASPAVMAAQGSILTNKYAEGYPEKRYYGGCEFVDRAEQLAIDRAMTLFGADTPTCSPTRAPRPTWPPTLPCSNPATRCWAWTWPTAAT
jgi:glycine hydroxymethyltransferase